MPLMPLLPTCRPDRHPCKSSPAYVYMIVVPYIYYIYLLHLVLLHLVSPSTLYRRSAPSAAYRPGTCSTTLGVLSVRIRISVQNDAGRHPHCRWYHGTAAELYEIRATLRTVSVPSRPDAVSPMIVRDYTNLHVPDTVGYVYWTEPYCQYAA